MVDVVGRGGGGRCVHIGVCYCENFQRVVVVVLLFFSIFYCCFLGVLAFRRPTLTMVIYSENNLFHKRIKL